MSEQETLEDALWHLCDMALLHILNDRGWGKKNREARAKLAKQRYERILKALEGKE